MRRSKTRGAEAVAVLTLMLAVLFVSCRAPLAPPDAAVRIGDRTVKYGDFEQYLNRSVGLETVLGSEVLSGLLDQFIDELLLSELAVREGVDAGSTGWEKAQALVKGRTERVSKEDVNDYYNAHRDDFVRPERVRLRQILAAERTVADEIARRLRQGASFESLMAEKGSEVSGRDDELSREDVPGAFADIIFGLAPGELSQVISVEYGFHLFQVVERLPAERVGLDRATPEIVDRLIRDREDQALGELVAEARDRYNVVIYERNLPFNYRGLYGTKKNQSDDE